jgi:hypothetical protein
LQQKTAGRAKFFVDIILQPSTNIDPFWAGFGKKPKKTNRRRSGFGFWPVGKGV